MPFFVACDGCQVSQLVFAGHIFGSCTGSPRGVCTTNCIWLSVFVGSALVLLSSLLLRAWACLSTHSLSVLCTPVVCGSSCTAYFERGIRTCFCVRCHFIILARVLKCFGFDYPICNALSIKRWFLCKLCPRAYSLMRQSSPFLFASDSQLPFFHFGEFSEGVCLVSTFSPPGFFGGIMPPGPIANHFPAR